MKDYKRLTERITASNTGRIVLIIPSFRHEIIKQTNRLAELEDKIESGELCDRGEVRKEILTEVCTELIDEFVKSSKNQDWATTKKVLLEVCPAKVKKICKRIAKKYGVDLEEQQ